MPHAILSVPFCQYLAENCTPPPPPEASVLFLLMAEEEQAEKDRKAHPWGDLC